MKAVLSLLLFMGATCLAVAESVIPALSDDVTITYGSMIFIGDGDAMFLALKDSDGREVRLRYERYAGSDTPGDNQFQVLKPAQVGSTMIPRYSKDEKVLVTLIRRAYRNTFGNPDTATLPKWNSPDHRKQYYALTILRAVEKRDNRRKKR